MAGPGDDGRLLVLVRHAKSSWKLPVSDLQRPLNKRGRRDAPAMANRLRAWLTAHQRDAVTLWVSPAQRAQETADCFSAALAGLQRERETIPALYGAGVPKILSLLRKRAKGQRTLVLFGHNPGFTDTINALSGAGLENLPTSGFACLLLPRAGNWRDIESGSCDLLELDYPKRHLSAGTAS